MNKALLSSAKDDWGTPVEFFARLHDTYKFTVDVCATDKNAKLPRYFTPLQDGLAQDWSNERCWMNPPYGKHIKKWMQKAWKSSKQGAFVVCLVPARTDTAWWHDYAMKGEITFLRGRLKFQEAKHSAPFPCALVKFTPPAQNGGGQ